MLVNKTPGPNATAEVVIVGGGVIGLTIARALTQRGVREVMLIERGRLGAEASWAAGGILAPQVEVDHKDDLFELACARVNSSAVKPSLNARSSSSRMAVSTRSRYCGA